MYLHYIEIISIPQYNHYDRHQLFCHRCWTNDNFYCRFVNNFFHIGYLDILKEYNKISLFKVCYIIPYFEENNKGFRQPLFLVSFLLFGFVFVFKIMRHYNSYCRHVLNIFFQVTRRNILNESIFPSSFFNQELEKTVGYLDLRK